MCVACVDRFGDGVVVGVPVFVKVAYDFDFHGAVVCFSWFAVACAFYYR